jgi:integrating conjugative element protein (TIGR03759 family)
MKASSLFPWLCLLVIFPTLDGLAVETGTTITRPVNTGTSQTNINEDVVTPNNRFHRSQWGLNETEWQRYSTLMQGIRGSISQANLSPLEVLGIHAETEQERRDYASRLAKMVHEDTERVLAFTRVYQEEASKLTPSPALIDTSRWPRDNGGSKKASLQAHDRLLFFTRLSDCSTCDGQLARLLKSTHDPSIQLDIYLINAKNDAEIMAWAQRQPLDRDRLKNKTITLNHDQGTLTSLAGLAGTAPKTILIRGKTQVAVDPLALN